MSVNGTGASYAPLKQILSDSESEEEHKVENAFLKTTDSCNNLDFNSGLQSSKNYSISDMDEFNTNVNTLESTMDNVSILQSEIFKELSFPRRCAFVISVIICAVTTVIFFWGMPCEGESICTGTHWEDDVTWEVPYDDIELWGRAQIVNGAVPGTKNLIFIYRGNRMKKNINPNDNSNGVLLIVGKTGKVGWYTRENRIPTYIHCNLIDINKDKQKDCIVSGTEGLLSALNPLSGTYYWYVHKQGNFLNNITTIDSPVAIKDIDNDTVDDLLTVATIYPNTNHNSLLAISGATGNIINDFVTLEDCASVKLMYEPDIVTYICKNTTTEAVRTITYPLIMKINETTNHTPIISPAYTKINNITWKENGKEVYEYGAGKLFIENSGQCPDSCRVNLKLVFKKDGVTNVTWEYATNHVYAMKPLSFIVSNTIYGFIIKLRQWNSAQVATGSQKVDEIRYNIQNKSPKNPYDVFHYQPNINIPSIASYIKESNFTAYSILEWTVLITYDKVQMHNVNISQADIVQLCAQGPIDLVDSSLPICQPNLDYQDKPSILIADLNGDKYHEIISYYSTFIAPEQYTANPNTDDSWRLTSIIKVIKLETILPNLFVANN